MSLFDTFSAINKAMGEETTTLVQLWMGWMGFIFLVSVFFAWRYNPARLVFVAMLGTMAAVLYIWSLTKNVHLFGVAHILIWFPLALLLWDSVLSKKSRARYQDHQPFFIWIVLVCLTIIVSLMFDARDIYLVMHDSK